jgi:hypothetical protein
VKLIRGRLVEAELAAADLLVEQTVGLAQGEDLLLVAEPFTSDGDSVEQGPTSWNPDMWGLNLGPTELRHFPYTE